MSAPERWCPVPGYEGLYEVSDQGRVRSLDRIGLAGQRLTGRTLRPQRNSKSGHVVVALYRDGRKSFRKVHQVVAEAFIGPRPLGALTRHLNDVADDNRAVNLAYGTHADNLADARRNGRQPPAAPHGTASRYGNQKCRCQPCRDAHAAKNRLYAAAGAPTE
ncbi:NUMOD4 motif-containing HNH endonuclease [Microbacterium aurugineum]|uniref:NUMOD4 motif-containing HNH endonuclease n=1 Tax=Microbacterium aurugineum TaxID=2851642 RepID=UPI0039BE5D5E